MTAFEVKTVSLNKTERRSWMVMAAAMALAMGSTASAQTWDGGAGTPSWNDGPNWSANAVPAAGGTVTINGDGGIQPVLNGASNALNATNISGGSLTVNSTLTSTTVNVSGTGSLAVNISGQIVGTVNVDDAGLLKNDGSITGILNITGGVVNNAGVVTGATSMSGGTLNLQPGTNLSNSALLNVTGGTVNVGLAELVGGIVMQGGTLQGPQALSTNGTFSLAGGTVAAGASVLAGGAKTLSGGTIAGALGGAGSTTLDGGTTTLSGTINGDVSITATGGLVGSPTARIVGDVTNGGDLRANGLTIEGSLTLGSSGRLLAPTGGLVVTETAYLGGLLSFSPVGIAFMLDLVEFELLQANAFEGSFDDIDVAGGPANYAFKTSIGKGGEFDRLLLTFTRRPTQDVPEPSMVALLGLSLIGCLLAQRRRRAVA